MTAKMNIIDKPNQGSCTIFFIEYDSRLEGDFQACELKQIQDRLDQNKISLQDGYSENPAKYGLLLASAIKKLLTKFKGIA